MGIREWFNKKKTSTTVQQPAQKVEVKNIIGAKFSYNDLVSVASYMPVDPCKVTSASDKVSYALVIRNDNYTLKNKYFKSRDTYEYFEAVNYKVIKGTLTNNGWAIYAQGRNNILIENCVFESIKGGNFVSCAGITFRNCYFKDVPGALHFKNCNNITIENCTIEINESGLYTVSALYVGGGCNNITIKDTKVTSGICCGKAFRFGNDGMAVTNAKVDNCEVSGSFSSIGFVIGTSGTASSPVVFSNITAKLSRSWNSVKPTLDASGKPVALYYCNGASTCECRYNSTTMDMERPIASAKIKQTGCTTKMN